MTNKKKRISYKTEEQQEMFRFLIVLGVIIVLVIGVYFVSKLFILDNSLFEVSYTDGALNYQRAIVGTVFNRPENEYYVMAYDEKDTNAVYYSAISTKYTKNQESALNVYHVDLSNELNKSAFVGKDGTSNSKATKATELKLKDLTLIKIKNGKIVKYIEDVEQIKKELAVTKQKES